MSNEDTDGSGENDSSFAAHYLDVEAGCRVPLATADCDATTALQRQEQQPLQAIDNSTQEELIDLAEHSDEEKMSLVAPADTQVARMNSLLLDATKNGDVQDIERLIKAGASPNATCVIHGVSVCHLAALRADDALSILLTHGAEKHRLDTFNQTPLHFAAWTGNDRQIALLLGISKDLQNRLEAGDPVAAEEEIEHLRQNLKEFVNVKQVLLKGDDLHPSWMDNRTYHNCREFADDVS
uniref:Uncharacterized protein n=1 Tax=Heliothis virescens TaxID=7102 RepID=A0A2A4JB97_HELVI